MSKSIAAEDQRTTGARAEAEGQEEARRSSRARLEERKEAAEQQQNTHSNRTQADDLGQKSTSSR